jgi:hypothetical protein
MSDLDSAFTQLARTFLARHPDIVHEWREVTTTLAGTRVDLICLPGTSREVFASLWGYQIAIGSRASGHDDFEDFGRGLNDYEVAQEAFNRFVELLRVEEII